MLTARRFISGAVGSLLVRVTAALLMLVLSIVVARSTTTDIFGWYNFCLVVVTFAALLTQAGLDKACIRFVPVYLGGKRYPMVTKFIVWGNVRIAALFPLVLVGVLLVIGVALRGQAWLVVGLFSILLTLSMAYMQFWQQVERAFDNIIRSQVPEQILVPAVMIVLIAVSHTAHASLSLEYVLGVHLAAISLAFAYLGFRLRGHLSTSGAASTDEASPGNVNEHATDWTKVAWPLALAGLMSFVLIRGEVVLLGLLLGPDEVAIYSVALRIANLMVFGLSASAAIAGPRFSTLRYADDLTGLQSAVSHSALFAVIVCLPIVVAAALFPDLILGLFGPDYTEGKALLWFFVVINFINIAVGPVAVLLSVTGEQNFYLKVVSIVGAAKLACLPVAAIAMGTWGVAVVSGAATVAWTAWLARGVVARLGILPLPIVPGRTRAG